MCVSVRECVYMYDNCPHLTHTRFFVAVRGTSRLRTLQQNLAGVQNAAVEVDEPGPDSKPVDQIRSQSEWE